MLHAEFCISLKCETYPVWYGNCAEKKGYKIREKNNINILGFNLKGCEPALIITHWYFLKLKKVSSEKRGCFQPSVSNRWRISCCTQWKRPPVYIFTGTLLLRNMKTCCNWEAWYPVSQREMLFLIKSLISIVMLGLWLTLAKDQQTRVENEGDLWAQIVSSFGLPGHQLFKKWDLYVFS